MGAWAAGFACAGQGLRDGSRGASLPDAVRALLAQLVEHFHGKEGVTGSSPVEGFLQIRASRIRAGGVIRLLGRIWAV